ncbi:GDSL-type esterase/lipase family protein [Kitasatospora sp. NBC_00240]|uniref:GDSL-type esterase/lipase family protein n=1 Tax=Kitasatospora sp. NBC_00240 TaxID=2903567 RepID=UPI00225774A5|nr:GDSL-type esterase/lipase family protein [Kitasatospora sp. NBC_00240]MCX5215526.1 GDSL-type esterase/lipase family protein [Kitasatospora sp. NBC_00240]
MSAVPSVVPGPPAIPEQIVHQPAGPHGRQRIITGTISAYKWLLMKHSSAARFLHTPDGRYGPPDCEALTLLVLGDSLALSIGVRKPEETFGSLLAQSVTDATGLPVDLRVLAKAGATTNSMQHQVTGSTRYRPGIAVVIIGSNDTLLPAPIGRCTRYFGHAVSQLRDAGWEVVVMPCADPGAAPGFRIVVRWLASPRARRLARRQRCIAQRFGALIAPSSIDDFRTRATELLSHDGVQPSPQGYAEHTGRVLPILLEAAARLGPLSDSLD